MVAAVGCLERRTGSARRPGRPVEGVDARLEERGRDSLPQQARALVRWHDAAHDEVAVARERGQLARRERCVAAWRRVRRHVVDVEWSAELVVVRARMVVLLLSLVRLRLRLRRSLVALKLWSAPWPIVDRLEVDHLCVSRQLEVAARSLAHLAAGEVA